MPLESSMPSEAPSLAPTPPTSYLNGLFDDLESLATLTSHGRRATSIQSSEWPLDLQSNRGDGKCSPQPPPIDSEKDSLGAAIDRIGASGDVEGGGTDDGAFGGANTPDLIGSSLLGSSLGSLGLASLSLGGTPESIPLAAARVVPPDEWDSRSSFSKNKSEAPPHPYREDTIMPASPTRHTSTINKDIKSNFRRSSFDSTVMPPDNSVEIIGTLEGNNKSYSTDRLPKARRQKQSVPNSTDNIQAAPPRSNSKPLSPVSGALGKGVAGRGRHVTPLQARNFSPEIAFPNQPIACTSPSTGVFPPGSVRSLSRASGGKGAQLANDYEDIMPLDLSLLRDSYATMGLGSFNFLSSTSGSPTYKIGGGAKGEASFTLGGGSVMREASFTLDTSCRRQSTGILSSNSNASRSGYRRYGGTVASVSALEKHIPAGEASALDFSLNSGPLRRARSAESSRANSFTLSDTTPVQRRVSPPSTSSEHRALFEELIRLRSEQEGSGNEWASAQLNASPEFAHPLGDGGDLVFTSPNPLSSHYSSVHIVPYPPPPIQPGDIVRTTQPSHRRRYKPDVVPVSLVPLCRAMETGEVERPERVWYVHPRWSEGAGDGGGAQRVIQYPITTPPLTPQQNVNPRLQSTSNRNINDKEWSLDENVTYDKDGAPSRRRGGPNEGEVSPIGSPHPQPPTTTSNGRDNNNNVAPSPIEYCIFQGKKIPVRERDRRIQEETERKKRLRDAAAAYLSTEKPNRRGLDRLVNAPVISQPRVEVPLRPTFLPLPEQRPRGLSPLQQRPRPSSCN